MITPDRSSQSCAKCRTSIFDKYYLATKDGVYHSHCLRCEHCDLELDGQVNCYNRNGQIYCRTDYERLFHQSAAVCSKCGLIVQVGQFVQRASSSALFHLDCFRCAICDTFLQPGQRYALLQTDSGHKLFCELHFANPNNSNDSNDSSNNTSSSSKFNVRFGLFLKIRLICIDAFEFICFWIQNRFECCDFVFSLRFPWILCAFSVHSDSVNKVH